MHRYFGKHSFCVHVTNILGHCKWSFWKTPSRGNIFRNSHLHVDEENRYFISQCQRCVLLSLLTSALLFVGLWSANISIRLGLYHHLLLCAVALDTAWRLFFLPVLSCRLNYFSEQKHKIHILKEYLYTCGWSQTAWLCWFLISYFSRSFSAFPSCWTADQDLLSRAESQRNISIIEKWGSIQSKWSTYPVFLCYSC